MKKIKTFLVLISMVILTSFFDVLAAGETLTTGFLCDSESLIVFRLAGYAIYVIKIVVPLIIIGQALVELTKVAISGEDKDMKSMTANLIKRMVAGILIFFIPALVSFALSIVNGAKETQSDFNKCNTCLLHPLDSKCESYVNNVDNRLEVD